MSKIPGILALCHLELAKRTAYNVFEKINEWYHENIEIL